MGIYKDGGTYTFFKNGKTYYVDRRIGSKTIDKVYDRYPGDAGAKIVDIKPPKKILKYESKMGRRNTTSLGRTRVYFWYA